ncbi:MAG: hypothetical protein ABR570_14020, partial [Burkholderiales bacterium]
MPTRMRDIDELLSRLKEVEELMQFPTVASHVERAARLSVSIARNGPSPSVVEAAMNLVRAVELFRREKPPLHADERVLQLAILRLRAALESHR